MSPQAKARLNLGALGSAIVVVAGFAWGGVPKVLSVADSRWVRNDSFAAYQAGESRRHVVDSLTATAKLLAIQTMLAGLDSSDRCRRKQTNYCR